MASQPSLDLQSFPNPNPERDYEIILECPEFTCLCPLTGQPDFASFRIIYVPDQRCVELKSLKLYLWAFRNEGVFHEKFTNRMADDIIALIDPRKLRIEAHWNVRGGITTLVNIDHVQAPKKAGRAAKPGAKGAAKTAAKRATPSAAKRR